MNKNQEKQYYFLIAGNVVFGVKDQDGDVSQMGSANVNGIVKHTDPVFPSRLIARAQQTVQMHFIKRMGEDAHTTEILDVVILSVSNLGLMSEEEFMKAPEGMQEVQREVH